MTNKYSRYALPADVLSSGAVGVFEIGITQPPFDKLHIAKRGQYIYSSESGYVKMYLDPLIIVSHEYIVVVFGEYMRIGCTVLPISEWKLRDTGFIFKGSLRKMLNGFDYRLWKQHRQSILALADAHLKEYKRREELYKKS